LETTIRIWKLAELAALLEAELEGPAEAVIERPVPAGSNDPFGITFAESETFAEKVRNSKVGAVILPPGLDVPGTPTLRSPQPRESFFRMLHLCNRPRENFSGIHPSAVVHETAQVDPLAVVGPFCVIEARARVGARTELVAFVFVGSDASIGTGCLIEPGSSVMADTIIGNECILHSGSNVGTDGFGFVWTGSEQLKIPQVGRVVIEDRCDIGSNTCIDRATCGDTVIRRGTKIDNLVQVGHNVQIGSDSVIASMVGISGSSTLGDRVTIAGQVGIVDHVEIGNDVSLGGRTGVVEDLPGPGMFFGTPAMPLRDGLKQLAAMRRLPELLDRVKKLEARVRELEDSE